MAIFFSVGNSSIVSIMMTKDLSEFHSRITEGFARQKFGDDALILDEECNFFRDHGYLAGVRLLEKEQIAALRSVDSL